MNNNSNIVLFLKNKLSCCGASNRWFREHFAVWEKKKPEHVWICPHIQTKSRTKLVNNALIEVKCQILSAVMTPSISSCISQLCFVFSMRLSKWIMKQELGNTSVLIQTHTGLKLYFFPSNISFIIIALQLSLQIFEIQEDTDKRNGNTWPRIWKEIYKRLSCRF